MVREGDKWWKQSGPQVMWSILYDLNSLWLNKSFPNNTSLYLFSAAALCSFRERLLTHSATPHLQTHQGGGTVCCRLLLLYFRGRWLQMLCVPMEFPVCLWLIRALYEAGPRFPGDIWLCRKQEVKIFHWLANRWKQHSTKLWPHHQAVVIVLRCCFYIFAVQL